MAPPLLVSAGPGKLFVAVSSCPGGYAARIRPRAMATLPPRSKPVEAQTPAAGADAPIRAAQRADELLAAGDMNGRAVSLRILEAVKELMATKPAGQVH